jgi:GNAT superfamily N-acetyltransferase
MRRTFDPLTAELSAEPTWPAEEVIAIGPWRAGASHGYTRRANSVRTAHTPVDTNWADLINKAEDFHRIRNLRPTFHISPATVPDNLDELLNSRGYALEAASEVWSADPQEVLAATRRDFSGTLIQNENPDPLWLSCAWDDHDHTHEARKKLCDRIPSPCLFALVTSDNIPVSRALCAIHSNIAWLYGMATDPSHQRRGFATQIIRAIAEWAIAHSAQAIYLQVHGQNAPALALYARATFTHQYNYHYRILR